MRARTSMKLLCEGPVNLYLLCAVVSKQTRRLESLIPGERIAELVQIALRNCADHEFEIQVDANTPDVIREAAARLFPPARIVNAALGSSPNHSDRRQTEKAVSAIGGQYATEGRQIHGESHLYKLATGIHVSVGNGVDSPDPCRNLHDRQGDYSMSNSKGIDTIHLRQLRAFAENLWLQANRHCKNQNYVVAHALYGRALEAAQRTDNPEHKENGNALVDPNPERPASCLRAYALCVPKPGKIFVGESTEGWSMIFIPIAKRYGKTEYEWRESISPPWWQIQSVCCLWHETCISLDGTRPLRLFFNRRPVRLR